MNKLLQFFVTAFFLSCYFQSFAQDSILSYDFTTKSPAAGSWTASGLSSIGKNGCTGDGYSAQSWDPGDYIEIAASTSGFTGPFTISFNSRTSNTGTSDVLAVQISSGNTGSNFVELGTYSLTTTCGKISFSTPGNATDYDNNANVKIRIIKKSGNSNGGNHRIDDFLFTGYSVAPTLLTSVSSVSSLTYEEGSSVSNAKTFNLSGRNLNPASGSIALTAPENFEISLDNTTFSNTLSVSYSSNALASTPLYVRLKTGLPAGAYPSSGTSDLTISGGTANVVVKVSGYVSQVPTGTEPCAAASVPISSARAGSVGATFTVTGRITGIFSGTNIYIQDATGGILIYDNAGKQPEELRVGDEVQVTGNLTEYNTEKELASLTCFQKTTAANNPVTPLVIAPADLCNHQGELITLNEDVTVSSPAGTTFLGSNTNYTLSNGLIMRVLSSTNLSGATRPSSAFKPTGVVTIFNNGCQILPRSVEDVPGSTPLQGGSCGTATASTSETKLEVTNWNVEWLGNTQYGPTNETLQLNNVKTVLSNIGSDVFMLQEVCSYNAANPSDPSTSFGALIQGLNATYPTRQYAGECSSRYSYSEVASPDPMGQRVCIIYRTDQITKVASRPLLTNASVTNYPTGNNSQFWASGRLPFLFQADVKLNSATEATRMNFIVLHAKSGSDVASYDRRVYDYKVLYDSLQAQFASEKIIMAGDFNDDVDQSIAGSNQISSIKAFLYANPATTNIADTRPNANWSCLSRIFSTAGCASTVSYSDYIDHAFVSNEIVSTNSGGRTLASVVSVDGIYSLRPSVSNYANTTTDHYPTFTQVSITADNPTPVTWLDFKGKLNEAEQVELTWATASEKNNSHFEIQRSKDGQNFETLANVAGKGNSTSVIRYQYLDETPGSGLNYYRLKQMDVNGNAEVSRAISVEVDALRVGPNPTANVIRVDSKGLVEVQLYSLSGVLLKKSLTNEIQMTELASGSYLLKISTAHSTTYRKVVKQ
ncbi:hypothetical protein BWI96_06600 [Siphonobacter sp. SORGH_AS_0500]|uniref:DUF5689 domain-containing protein n=1 Tax=Siphonobacter sp. SORGH_AS_0500 TaxID=1864824 RepID=UPI000CC1127C|nr:DUF5689 domain-containing protein [Siphonobacter sp. SORGH_AS_0500]PKK37527.1 hypothetical protein BWI96_06600 [Siphonobacter sp. SORGH_AS_0500]